MNGFPFSTGAGSGVTQTAGSPAVRALKVSEVNNYIKSVLMYDSNLTGIYVTGELSNYKRYSSGHAYFSLKDKSGVLKCVMFNSAASKLTFQPQDGMSVTAFGSIGVYERDGVYQLYVESMRQDGIGTLYEQFELLKKKLAAEGLFDAGHKRALPLLPKAVAAVTSPSGAVIRDIQNVMGRRFPAMPLILYPAAVQGADAPGELLAGLLKAQAEGRADVIIIGRGGGSIEDLWAFNDEKLARTIYDCRLPVISAVGHETDYTICDFVADLRAPTPSAAAELAVPVFDDLMYGLDALSHKLTAAATVYGTMRRKELERISAGLGPGALRKSLEIKRQLLNRNDGALRNFINSAAGLAALKLEKLSRELEAYSYENVLKRGFALVKSDDGALIKTAEDFRNAGTGRLIMADGTVRIREAEE